MLPLPAFAFHVVNISVTVALTYRNLLQGYNALQMFLLSYDLNAAGLQ